MRNASGPRWWSAQGLAGRLAPGRADAKAGLLVGETICMARACVQPCTRACVHVWEHRHGSRPRDGRRRPGRQACRRRPAGAIRVRRGAGLPGARARRCRVGRGNAGRAEHCLIPRQAELRPSVVASWILCKCTCAVAPLMPGFTICTWFSSMGMWSAAHVSLALPSLTIISRLGRGAMPSPHVQTLLNSCAQ